jgi:O-antigen ligase
VILVFLRFSALPEIIGSITGVSTYVIYLFGPVAVLAVIASGRLGRVFRENTARFWLLFALWMILAVAFSSWRGDSLTAVINYLKANFIILVTIAGLARTWSDCRKIIYAVAAAGVVNMATAYFFQATGPRLSLAVAGSIGNSDDLAAHLLLVLPFLLFIALKPRTRLLLRLLSIVAVAFGIYQIFKTATRGALVALVLTVAFVFIRGSLRQKVVLGASAVVTVILLSFVIPSYTWQRLGSFSRGAGANEEALESSDERQYLLKQSIIYTLDHPVFGVGPGQFINYLGKHTTEPGHHGLWRAAHNAYTEISSECGIPALAFYFAAVISTFTLLARVRKRARGAHRQEILVADYCLKISLIAYNIVLIFTNFGYRYEILTVSGLAVVMWFVVNRKTTLPVGGDARLGQLASEST